MSALRVPTATYRFQFNSDFTFNRALELIPYLHKLGITDLYCSPVFQAQRGSAHGYDVTDPTRINPEIGGEEEFESLAGTLRQYDMGLLMDIVPNHMAVSIENPWWLDVLRHGPQSPYAPYFDINWQSFYPGLRNKVLLPILGDSYGKVLENQELILKLDENGFWICYYNNCLPISPVSHSKVLEYQLKCIKNDSELDQQIFIEQLKNLISMFQNIPSRQENAFDAEFRKALDRLWHLYINSPGFKGYVDQTMEMLNGKKGYPTSFNALDKVLDEQAYRLASWRVANQEINYRRFFNVSDKVCLNIEKDFVFQATHARVLELAQKGLVNGLRIDHIDGLYNPWEYLKRLQAPFPNKGEFPGLYVVAEKILGQNESLPVDWPVYGTTGYDFLNVLNNLFVDRYESHTLERIYDGLSGVNLEFDEVVYAQKRRVMALLFAVEVSALARHLYNLAEQERHARDIMLTELEQALTEVIACFPVYRTYIRDFTVTSRDRKCIEYAIDQAVREFPDISLACEFLRRVLLLDFPEYLSADQQQAWLGFVMRWQQFTGPIMAKGFEDTALYVYNQLVSLNEVGGDPRDTGISVAEFHRRNDTRQKCFPYSLNATSTHDTKRSEDVRARINVVSEIPHLWAERVKKWGSWNQTKKQVISGQSVPDGNTELLIYQTLIGAWPMNENEIPEFKERLKDYLVKSSREAKVYTSWLDTNSKYEDGLKEFAMNILEPGTNNYFLDDFLEFQKVTSFYGALNSLAQVLLKITSPGVPDFYQGMELWNYSLVDPDNRRHVDYDLRTSLLTELQNNEARNLRHLARELIINWQDGRAKLFLTYKSLHFRREHKELFLSGEYIPVDCAGGKERYICAYARRLNNAWALVIVPRLLASLRSAHSGCDQQLEMPSIDPPLGEKVWEESVLVLPEYTPDRWLNIFTGETIKIAKNNSKKVLSLADVFQEFPMAMLEGN